MIIVVCVSFSYYFNKQKIRLSELRHIDKIAFDLTVQATSDMIVNKMVAMIEMIKRDGKCSGEYPDEHWPKKDTFQVGMGNIKKIAKDIQIL